MYNICVDIGGYHIAIALTNNKHEIENIEFNLLNYEKELNDDLKIFNIKLEIGD